MWLLDHTSTILNQAARFADEFVAIHNQNSTKFKSVLAKISLAVTTNETGVNYAGNNYRDTYHYKKYGKPNSNNTKFTDKHSKSAIRCWKCSRFGHLRKNCIISEAKPRTVEFTICPPFDLVSRDVQNSNHDVDILYLPHMADGVFLNPRGTEVPIRILRDTGSLQSILTSSLLPNWKGLDTSECRFIKG